LSDKLIYLTLSNYAIAKSEWNPVIIFTN